MKKTILSTLVILAATVAFAKTETKSVYSEVSKDCIEVSSATEKAPIDFYSSECKAFGGYALKIEGGDLRYGPSLSFNGTDIDLQNPGAFHDMGSDKIEWVYDISRDEEGSGELKFKALIFRLNVANVLDPSKKDDSVLTVVRLNGTKSCVIGKVATNIEARTLANKASARCSVAQ